MFPPTCSTLRPVTFSYGQSSFAFATSSEDFIWPPHLGCDLYLVSKVLHICYHVRGFLALCRETFPVHWYLINISSHVTWNKYMYCVPWTGLHIVFPTVVYLSLSMMNLQTSTPSITRNLNTFVKLCYQEYCYSSIWSPLFLMHFDGLVNNHFYTLTKLLRRAFISC